MKFFSKPVSQADSNSSGSDEGDSAVLQAIRNNIGMIEFTPDGTILDANTLFLDATGYQRDELMGQHHRVLCPKSYAQSPAYRELWQALAEGRQQAAHFGVLINSSRSSGLKQRIVRLSIRRVR